MDSPDDRKARLAEALRANLRRRKAQARAMDGACGVTAAPADDAGEPQPPIQRPTA